MNSIKKSLYITGELNGSSYIKIPLRSSGILKIKNNDKYCLIWSIFAFLHPCENDHPSRVRNYKQFFNELTIPDFDYTNGCKCIDVHWFEKTNSSSLNIFELNFYQDQNNLKHNFFPLGIVKMYQIKLLTY